MRNLAILLAFGAFASANAAILNYSSSLQPYFEVNPPSDTDAFTQGSFGLELDTVTGAVQGTFTGLSLSSDVTGYHIHVAPPGVNGPIAADLADLPVDYTDTNTFNGRNYFVVQFSGNVNDVLRNGFTLDSLVTALNTGNAYANLHTQTNPGGEIRGQISLQPVPEPASMAALGLGALALLRRRKKA